MLAWNYIFQLVELSPQVLTIGKTALICIWGSTPQTAGGFWFCSLALKLLSRVPSYLRIHRRGRGEEGPGAGGLKVGPFLTILPTTDPPSLISYTFLQLYLFSAMPLHAGLRFCRFNPEGLQQGKYILHCALCACVWKAHPFGDPSSSLSVHTFRP